MTTKEKLELLNSMQPNDIAKYLKKGGYFKGTRRKDGANCPIQRFLNVVAVGTLVYLENRDDSLGDWKPIPNNVSDFISNYDNGHYD